jgi:hypothetical protein
MLEQMTKGNPIAKMPGFEALRAQQEAFFKAMTGGLIGSTGSDKDDDKKR